MSNSLNLISSTDEQLTNLIKVRDPSSVQKQEAEMAFNSLYDRHAPFLLAFLKVRVSPHINASDIAQETWMRAWQKIPTHFDGSHFRGWLFQIARNLLLDEFRKKKTTSLNEDIDLPETQDSAQEFIQQEEKTKLRDCMSQLDEVRQKIVKLRLSGESHREISERLNVEYNTVQTRFHRAKQFLEDCVNQQEKETA
ncbi:MAG: sigma-70 family RNA polymerase sigma factor [Planctomycetes bacterium]|nr:sigma-70 family RNA polymerase sigma factor [Planctomycetota bacterium]MCH9723565.1 sigma-70 family RNA polymerase sigma factor [Planctomycetota bacterium]MCH9775358.1 sigma-70 family RNA polymerase sigma factor [Planctomycetota bacterium]MDF1744994.1 sigma-70 family RNA polymerase sigma factor [Gimesia sp.]